MTLASETSPTKGTQTQNYLVASKHPTGNPTGNEPVYFLNCAKNSPTEIHNSEQYVTTTIIGDPTILLFPTTTPLTEEGW